MAYSEEEIENVFNKILKQIANDGKALRNILKQDKMPSSQTFYRWLEDCDLKSKRYAQATRLRSDYMFDQILEIADATENDVVLSEDGTPIVNHNVIQRDRLRVDARKWYLSKINPLKYGDKIENTIQGGDKPLNIISLGDGVNPNETTS